MRLFTYVHNCSCANITFCQLFKNSFGKDFAVGGLISQSWI